MVRRRYEYIDEMTVMFCGAGLNSERLLLKNGDCQSQAGPGFLGWPWGRRAPHNELVGAEASGVESDSHPLSARLTRNKAVRPALCSS